VAAPLAAQGGAPSPVGDPVLGERLRVSVLTLGPGAQVWERFGHNALRIRNLATGEDLAYNWGIFSFQQPGFLRRFLTGDTQYWMEPDAARTMVERARLTGRDVVEQELDLTASERAALYEFVGWNAAAANRYYRYDYFRDNCSTRVREALDRVLAGLLKRSLSRPAGTTYRAETERLLGDDLWLTFGVDAALGARADVPLTTWEASFIPMRLRDALRGITRTDSAGVARRLVAREEVLVARTRAPERDAPPDRWLGFFAMGLLVAGAIAAMARSAHGADGARVSFGMLAAAAALVAGALGTVILLMGTATRHDFWGANPAVAILNPLGLVAAVVVPWAAWARRGPRRLAVTVTTLSAATAVAGAAAVVAGVAAGHQVAAFFAPVQVGLALGTWIATRAPNPTAA
jgi:hypothetical protein